MARTLKATGLGAKVRALFAVDDDNTSVKEFKNGWTSGSGLTLTNISTTTANTWKTVTVPMIVLPSNGAIDITNATAVAVTSPVTFFAIFKNSAQIVTGSLLLGGSAASGGTVDTSQNPFIRFGSGSLVPALFNSGTVQAVAQLATPLTGTGEHFSFALPDSATADVNNVAFMARESQTSAETNATTPSTHGNANFSGAWPRRIPGAAEWYASIVVYGWIDGVMTQAEFEAMHADPLGEFFEASGTSIITKVDLLRRMRA